MNNNPKNIEECKECELLEACELHYNSCLSKKTDKTRVAMIFGRCSKLLWHLGQNDIEGETK